MSFKILNPRHFWSGVLFIVIGLAYASTGWVYGLGTVISMGPGFFPFYLGMIMACLGVALVFFAFKTVGERMGRFYWKPIARVIGSICVFALLLNRAGVIIAGLLLVIGASLGSREFKWRSGLLLALVLVAFCTLVFVIGLKLPVPICPDHEWFKSFSLCRRM